MRLRLKGTGNSIRPSSAFCADATLISFHRRYGSGSHAFPKRARVGCRTASTARVVRQSLTLLPPQPSRSQGRQEWFCATTRASALSQGPHTISDEGPKSTTQGRLSALAMCNGRESTQIRQRHASMSAPSSFRSSCPARLMTGTSAQARGGMQQREFTLARTGLAQQLPHALPRRLGNGKYEVPLLRLREYAYAPGGIQVQLDHVARQAGALHDMGVKTALETSGLALGSPPYAITCA